MSASHSRKEGFSLAGLDFEQADALVSQSAVLFRYADPAERQALAAAGVECKDDFISLLTAIRKIANPADIKLSHTEQAALGRAGHIISDQFDAWNRTQFMEDGETRQVFATLQNEAHTLFNNAQVMSVMIDSRDGGKKR